MYRTIGLAAIAAACAFTHAHAGHGYPGEGFVRPITQIKGCIAIVDKVRDGSISPTEWMEANKEDFADLQIELKDRNYRPEKAKAMMMGMAITLCMERKGLNNTCVTASDPEKRDVQIMRTADVPECWAKERRAEPVAPPPPPPPPQVEPPIPPGPTVCTHNGWGCQSGVGPIPLPSMLPPMSHDDLAQFNEDMRIITSPPTSIYPYGNQGERFASCASHWQLLHYNRHPRVREVLYAVRVARCMYRTGFGFFQASCAHEFPNMLNPRCYARFG